MVSRAVRTKYRKRAKTKEIRMIRALTRHREMMSGAEPMIKPARDNASDENKSAPVKGKRSLKPGHKKQSATKMKWVQENNSTGVRGKGISESQGGNQEGVQYVQAKKNPVGRPVERTLENVMNEGRLLLEWMKADESNFWIKDFALSRGYTGAMLSQWAEKYEEFAKLYARARELQEGRLLKIGMFQAKNGSLAELALTNHHGWRKQPESTQTTNQLVLMAPEQARAVLANLPGYISPEARRKMLEYHGDDDDPIDADASPVKP